MIEVANLSKRFGSVRAVDDLSFTVSDGELFALLGRNGAGKSTTISCMTTILGFDQGTITLDGNRVGRDDHAIRESFGVVFQSSVLDPILSVEENLSLKASLYGIGRKRVAEVMEQVEVAELRERRYSVLSGGERRRVDIARALLHALSTLFLDEPTTGLDPQSRETVWGVIAQLRAEAGLTVLLTTHYMEETEEADHVLIMEHGKEIASGTPFELRASYAQPRLSLVLDSEGVAALPGVVVRVIGDVSASSPTTAHPSAQDEGGAWHLRVQDSAQALAILDSLRGHVKDFEFRHGSMDDVFLTVTRDTGAEVGSWDAGVQR